VSDRPFLPARLCLARDLTASSQAEVAERAGLTPAALSQFESGKARPTDATVARLGEALGVPTGFFELSLLDTHDGFFRSLRRTGVADRRRARAFAHIAHDLATCGDAIAQLPPPDVPRLLLEDFTAAYSVEPEGIAGEIRTAWRVHAGPIPDVVALLESHGIIVIRLPLSSTDVDAFSLPFIDRQIIVLGAEKNDRARSRFDAAHELGHLVMHGEQIWGTPEVERQAHRFAAAFLMPGNDIYDQLPERVDWPQLFALKRQWQVSLAALLMRARTLRRMNESDYLAAVKAASARGWRRVEPVPLGNPEHPQLLERLLDAPGGGHCRALLPSSVIETLATAIAA
jgi:Zn-dependent peptidase ImmA (M78 family)/transcriptional regulator with XRE-family HTH domain